MKLSTAADVITSIWSANPLQAVHIQAEPGVGKTSLVYQIAERMGMTPEQVVIFRPSLRDPVDVMGIPDVNGDEVVWLPPHELKQLESGEWVFCIDELPQGIPQMQNVLAGLMLDRFTTNLKLSNGVRVLSTGNRVEDKAGSNRLVSQLANRVATYDIDVALDDWKKWAYKNNISQELIAFLSLKPDALLDFNPDNVQNPTPRSWSLMDMSLDFDALGAHAMEAIAGFVGMARAVEYTDFRKLMPSMPDLGYILANPDSADIPSEPALLYAVCTGLVKRTTDQTIDAVFDYIERHDFPNEFMTMAVEDITTHEDMKPLWEHARVTQWALNNSADHMAQ